MHQSHIIYGAVAYNICTSRMQQSHIIYGRPGQSHIYAVTVSRATIYCACAMTRLPRVLNCENGKMDANTIATVVAGVMS